MVFPLIGALITGAASVASAAMANKKSTETTKTENVVDYKKMVDSATAAGFNPLTALRNGGSAGFSTTTTTSPSTSAMPAALANMGGLLGDAMSNALDPLEQKRRKLDTALVDYQLRQLKQGPRMPGTLYRGGETYGVKTSYVKPSSGKLANLAERGLIGPKMPPGAGKDGEILPFYVTWSDPAKPGRYIQTFNPQIPDMEQGLSGTAWEIADGAARITTPYRNRTPSRSYAGPQQMPRMLSPIPKKRNSQPY